MTESCGVPVTGKTGGPYTQKPTVSLDERLVVLGQIAVVRDRLDELEAALMPMEPNIVDVTGASGNLSLQTGILIGSLSRYQDATRKENTRE